MTIYASLLKAFLAALISCALLFSLPPLQTKLHLESQLPAKTYTQVFSEQYGQHQAPPQILDQGADRVSFTLPHGTNSVRWDPLGWEPPFNATSFSVSGTISFAAWSWQLTHADFLANQQILTLEPGPENSVHITTAGGLSPPIITLQIPRPIKTLTFGLIFTTLGAIFLVLLLHPRARSLIEKRRLTDQQTWLIFLGALIALQLASKITGQIPIGNGEGWDGGQFLNLVQQTMQGAIAPHDPYRTSRLGAFLPALVASGLGLSRSAILAVQAYAVLIMIAGAVALMFDFLRTMGLGRHRALVGAGILLSTWAVLVMPGFYPMLADHSTILLTASALWLWTKDAKLGLTASCILSTWVFPSAFPLILLLLAFPRQKTPGRINSPQNATGARHHKVKQILAFAVLFSIWTTLIVYLFESVPDETISDVLSRLSAEEKLGWREISEISVLVQFALISYIWSRIATSEQTFQQLNWRGLSHGLISVLIGYLSIRYFADLSSGYGGPKLLRNLIVQSASMPIRSIVAHVYYFGPVFLFSIVTLFWLSIDRIKDHLALAICIAAYLPLLAVGSESRQWIGILPILVAFFALHTSPIRLHYLCILGGLVLCLPGISLQETLELAQREGTSYTSDHWQSYFSRQGPWMSVNSWLSGLALITAITLIGAALRSPKKHAKEPR